MSVGAIKALYTSEPDTGSNAKIIQVKAQTSEWPKVTEEPKVEPRV